MLFRNKYGIPNYGKATVLDRVPLAKAKAKAKARDQKSSKPEGPTEY